MKNQLTRFILICFSMFYTTQLCFAMKCPDVSFVHRIDIQNSEIVGKYVESDHMGFWIAKKLFYYKADLWTLVITYIDDEAKNLSIAKQAIAKLIKSRHLSILDRGDDGQRGYSCLYSGEDDFGLMTISGNHMGPYI